MKSNIAKIKACANETRLSIILLLMDHNSIRPGTLADVLGIKKSALSGHLKKLLSAGIISVERHKGIPDYFLIDGFAAKIADLAAQNLHSGYSYKGEKK